MAERSRTFYYPDINYDSAYGERFLTDLTKYLFSNKMYERDEIPNLLNQELTKSNTNLTNALSVVARKIDTDFSVMEVFQEDFPNNLTIPKDVLSQLQAFEHDEILNNDCRLSGFVFAKLLQGIDFLNVGLSNYSYPHITDPVHLSVVVENMMNPRRKGDSNFLVVHFGTNTPVIRTYPNLKSAGSIMMPLNAESIGVLENEVASRYDSHLRILELELNKVPETNLRKRNSLLSLILLGR